MRLLTSICVFVVAAMPGTAAQSQTAPARVLTLEDVVRLAQAQGNAASAAQQTAEIARWRNQAFAARLRPRVSLMGNALGLNRGINAITGTTGETQYVSQAENESTVEVQISQRLRGTGGELLVSSGLNRIDLFGNRSGQSWQTTPLVVGFTQDVFRPNPLKWDERTQALGLMIAERQLAEVREEVASTAVAAFFDVYTADVDLLNAQSNAAVNDSIASISKVRFARGGIDESELLQSDYALLRARAAVDRARLTNAKANATLRRLLNLKDAEPLSLIAPKLLDVTRIVPDVAVQAALENGSLRDRSELEMVYARRQIEDARLNAGFGARMFASVGFNQTAPVFLDSYRAPLGRQRLGLSVEMPLLQWGAGKADLEAGRAMLLRAETDARTRRAEVAEEARFAALGFTQAESGLGIAAAADSVASRRFAITKVKYDRGTTTLTELFLAQTEKDAARASSAQSLRAYWVAYYQLRRITLYDFVANRRI